MKESEVITLLKKETLTLQEKFNVFNWGVKHLTLFPETLIHAKTAESDKAKRILDFYITKIRQKMNVKIEGEVTIQKI